MPTPSKSTIPADYEARVYAGVLGKIIGVYLGRPFEGWSNDKIERELGEVDYYVHEALNAPLVVTDDDISGTFTFARALAESGNDPDLTAAQIGDWWRNTIIEGRTILWWGGLGMSTEHTAFLRLKAGMKAPASGSIATNGTLVAEQIGAQIFIDGWGMVCPGDPARAADFARRAASVSHDGEAVYGAQVIAAMEALAFVEPDLNVLLDTASGLIPKESVIYRLIGDVRGWAAANGSDWRATLKQIQAHYGYDKFGGNCHMVPNHAVILLGLLHGRGDFQRSLMIANTAGWDTDCNSGNVGCLLGIKNGLAGLDRGLNDAGPDWRGPVADRLYLPTADGGRCLTDALRESYSLVNSGRALAGLPPAAPKDGARFHFSQPGSVQGFQPEDAPESEGMLTVGNEGGKLALRLDGLPAGRSVRAARETFPAPSASAKGGYDLVCSPTLYPGQTVTATVEGGADLSGPVLVRLYVGVHDDAGMPVRSGGGGRDGDAGRRGLPDADRPRHGEPARRRRRHRDHCRRRRARLRHGSAGPPDLGRHPVRHAGPGRARRLLEAGLGQRRLALRDRLGGGPGLPGRPGRGRRDGDARGVGVDGLHRFRPHSPAPRQTARPAGCRARPAPLRRARAGRGRQGPPDRAAR